MKPTISIQCTFKEWMQYKRWKGEQVFRGVYLGLIALVPLVGGALIFNILQPPLQKASLGVGISRWMGFTLQLSQTLTFFGVIKWLLLLMIPIVAIAWILHGVGVRLLA